MGISLLPTTTRANEACSQACIDALKRADAVIQDQEKVIDLYGKEIQILKSNFQQALDHADSYKKESEFKTNLLYVAIPAAILAGFVLQKELGR